MLDLPTPKTIIEPFRIKSVEPLPILSAQQRQEAIERAGYNLFALKSEDVSFDLLTDSGTSAMSSEQWAALMRGDESYAGSKSYTRFEESVRDITGFKYIIPTHQGRAAEALIMKVLVEPGQVVIGNTHFDTTRANIETSGAEALDMPNPENEDSGSMAPFKGDIDIPRLEAYLKEHHKKVAMLIMTVTNNSVGGQPVSMSNLKQAREISAQYEIPMFIDCARFAENAYFIKLREKGFENKSVKEIAQEMFSYADGAMMSSKKDAFANIGGFLALNHDQPAQAIKSNMVITEGFPTYGGLSGRDMDALAVGMQEVLDENYLAYRIKTIEYFGRGLDEAGFPTVKPYGGHAVYIDAGKVLPHIPVSQFPGQSLSIALYLYAGIRSVEVGSVMLGHKDKITGEEVPAPKELVRLAMPRRVYTQSHVDYMIECCKFLSPHTSELKGVEFEYEAPVLRHFTAKFKMLT